MTNDRQETTPVVAFTREQLANRPSWVEISDFEIFTLDQAYEDKGIRKFEKTAEREVIVALGSELIAESEMGRATLKRRDWLEIPPGGMAVSSMRSVTTPHYASSTYYPAEAIRIAGTWDHINHISIFQFRADRPLPVHYHDFNEYWLLFRGHPLATHDDDELHLHPGTLLATRTGHEHGIAKPEETVEGVGLQTSLVGRKRQGHLHRDVDGPPDPQ
jgi:mannose-6-phosphate isomerase-like protein (cupin superfamily)